MTRPRLLSGVILSAFLAAGAPAFPAGGVPPEVAAALDRAFADAEADHGRVRAGRLPEISDEVRDAVRTAWAAERARRAKAGADPATDGFARALAAAGLGWSRPTISVLADELAAADPPEPAGVAKAVDDALARIFAAEAFEDVWDRAFTGIPEVRAWRRAHEAAAQPRAQDPLPPSPGAPDPGPHAPPPSVPDPPGPAAVPEAAKLPPPHGADPEANLVLVDRRRSWVGPWTGWTQSIAAKDNRRHVRPAKTVWIDRYEVTCTEYLAFLRGLDASRRRAMLPVGWSLDPEQQPEFPAGRGKSPVTGVTLAQAEAYAESVGKRLPTEDEWERAADGGDREPRLFPWGSTAEERTWTWGGAGATGPGDVDASAGDCTPDGIVGLAGNVAEMVASLPDRRDLPAKVAADAEIVIRGGSWRTSRAADCAANFRWVMSAGQGAPHVGFRCVMDEAEYKRRFR